MRKLNSSLYLSIAQRLERMADGILRHANEPKFPGTLVESEYRQLKGDLSKVREDYEQKQREADLAYDRFTELLSQSKEQLSRGDSTIHGFYGKDNPIVADFGTSVVTRSRKPRQTASPTA